MAHVTQSSFCTPTPPLCQLTISRVPPPLSDSQHTNAEHICSFRTSHHTTPTNTEHICSFRTSHPTNTQTQNIYVPSEHLTQQTHKHRTYMFLQNISPNKHTNTRYMFLLSPHDAHQHNICSFKTSHNISNIPHLIPVRNILCY